MLQIQSVSFTCSIVLDSCPISQSQHISTFKIHPLFTPIAPSLPVSGSSIPSNTLSVAPFTLLCRSSLTHPILPSLSCSLAPPTHTPALYAASHCGTGGLEACLARQGSIFSVDYEISDECSALKTCQG